MQDDFPKYTASVKSSPEPLPLRVTLICNEYPPKPHGGIGTFVQSLAHGLAATGHVITVVGVGDSDNQYQDKGVRVISLRGSRAKYVGNLMSRLRLRRWINAQVRNKVVDLVETPDYMGPLPFGIIDCPVVVRLHLTATLIQLASGKTPSFGVAFYERRNLLANHNWVAVSNHIQKLTLDTFRIQPERLCRIYNPVAPASRDLPFLPDAPNKYILYASAVSKRKGALLLAEAARPLLTEQPDLHLVYVGGVPIEEQGILRTILTIVGPELTNRVRFVGHVGRPEVLAWMRNAMVYAFPSTLEACPLVVLEAMQMGAPMVCTCVPPGPELVQHGANGLLADPGSTADWTAKIRAILDSKDLRLKLRHNGMETIKNFSLERCVQATELFYRNCLANTSRLGQHIC